MITPIIMESSISEVEKKLGLLRERKGDRIHIDIGDGLFSDLITIAPADLQQFDLSSLMIDFHLMVDDPTEWMEETAALSPSRIIGQIERMGSQILYLDTIAGYGREGGLALKLETPIEEIEDAALEKCQTILLLAVPVGTTGSKFDQRVLPKIRELRKVYAGKILIDGGITKETYKQVIEAGGDEAAANSSYWEGRL